MASISAQPTRLANPTSGASGIRRQAATRAANLKTDDTPLTPSPGASVRAAECSRPQSSSACPGKVGTGFPIRTCATKKIRACPDSNGTGHALVRQLRAIKATRLPPTSSGRRSQDKLNNDRADQWNSTTQDLNGCDQPPIDSSDPRHQDSQSVRITADHYRHVTRAKNTERRCNAPGPLSPR
jgi:hypothetical protein